jgi:hypothetical protein
MPRAEVKSRLYLFVLLFPNRFNFLYIGFASRKIWKYIDLLYMTIEIKNLSICIITFLQELLLGN